MFVFCYPHHLFDVDTMPVADHKKKQELPVSPIPLTYLNEPAVISGHHTLLHQFILQALQTVLTA
ncbi:hypothetical protein J1785_17125 [Rahnella sp. SL6]|jgi:hypothetical protein|uniref:hypothetical protein n=1 Tax=Rahnella perminowiae TaxID=2816244 RepID=UPI00102269CE|nr:hypothetical protein [Rahnella perminowiae]MBU9811443.1 hypothetical protein [Rahnella perminowiae]UJD89681.1 hypothetical protein FS594_13185 [Rahnella aquatilis]